jgi:hypothetical protein
MHTLDGVGSQWDGKTGGKDAVDGTYFIILKAKGFNGKTYEEQAYITLIR